MVETGGLFERGDLFNLAKMVVLVVHKELKYKVEKLKNKKSEVMQARNKNKSELPVGEETIMDQSTRSFTVMID